MKKIIFLFVMLLMPITGIASIEKYNTLNLEETLKEEKIETIFSNYKENDKQIPIYLFRGQGCSFCRSFLQYLNELVDEYGNYFKLVSFEVWDDSKNSKLLDKVSEFLDEPAEGVPYIIIGEQVFAGYSKTYNKRIAKAIMDLYVSKDKYDVFDAMTLENLPVENGAGVLEIVLNALFITISTTFIIGYIYLKDRKLHERINELEKRIN